jgi:hypothetical protein
MFFRKRREEVLHEMEPDRSFLVQTNNARFMFHLLEEAFYVRKVTGKDRRYGLVVSLGSKKKYNIKDLDLGAEVLYHNPRLDRIVSGGRIVSVAVR